MAEANWYVVHTYSGYENKVKANIDKTIENRHLEDQYAGEAVFSRLLDFVSELLFCPRTENGAFLPELVRQER